MDSAILKQMQFIAETMGEQGSLNSLRKTSYVDGYKAALTDTQRLIELIGESLSFPCPAPKPEER